MAAGLKLELEGPQYAPLSDAFRKRFEPLEFRRMLKMRLNQNWYDLTSQNADFQQEVFDVIDTANRRGWVYRLVIAAREEVPGEPVFVEYAQMLQVAPDGTPDRVTLEAIITKTNAQLDIGVFLSRLGKIEAQVCRVDIDGSGQGTGFLVGPNTVLTNYHVVEPIAKGHKEVSALTCKFDFKVRANGASVNPGVDFKVTRLAGYSPYDPTDLKDTGQPPDPANLDYAVLDLAGEPGNAPIRGKPKGRPRGWIAVPDAPVAFRQGQALFIVQHPQTRPMKLALDTEAIIGLHGGGRRVRYRTNTEPGSSGSPCFNPEWGLVALHHSGDSNWAPAWNQGIPIHLVRGHAREQGIPLGDAAPPLEDDEY
jgi:hypothetical protein